MPSFAIGSVITVIASSWLVAVEGLDCHAMLQVERGADATTLKKAYRKQALKWHPDKNPSKDAEAKFRDTSACYERLSNPSAGGGSDLDRPFDSARAYATFEDLFGTVHNRWKPGKTVTGTIVSGGKKKKLTIYPDGTTEESEEKGSGAYSSVWESDGHSTSIQLSGDISGMVLDLLGPSIPLASFLLPVISMFFAFICNPLVCCGGCIYFCCFRGRKARTD
eukprot:TRINITY_DN82825_c0_g1_i1.p1 TRINITY_DN82825_c0_g1~~TRINITY_DN82825_c0_g1_i1.p1  ORF type:complete len:222 (+),score=33.44 TRINITY_DN82825_c0_g1_i1:112-777(+)